MDVVDEDRAAETLALGAMETCEGQDQDILDESKDTEIIEQFVRAAGIKMDPTEAIEIDLTQRLCQATESAPFLVSY